MGLAAHAVPIAAPDNHGRSTAVADSLPLLETEIRSLLDLPADAARPTRDAVEHTLTTGYAHALRLDAKRLRVERRLREVVRSAVPDVAARDEAVLELTRVDEELAQLRALLSTLRAQALEKTL
jgi:hypothetical protein